MVWGVMRTTWLIWVVLGVWCGCVGYVWDQGTTCQRSPPGTESPKTAGNNGYKIKISGDPEKYVPGEVYTVSIQGWRTQYSVQKFTGFMLMVDASSSSANLYGPQSVGTFQLYGDALTMHSDGCPNAVIQTSSISKSEIQVLWTAPPAGSGCVVFRATVVENRDQWYMDDGELTKELCEEVQESEDMQPEVIHDCCACDEAKYEVTFEGMWSRHTHPKDYPTNEWLTHFSDIIGASHSANYRVWKYGGFSSDGLRQVAEWGSTRLLESELKQQSDHIRTIIKARGLWYPSVNGKTFAVFRVDNRHHLMSLVSMLGPSPDWIVGVSALELCLRNCSWVDQKILNLYPWDSGTDSGISYESPNQPTIPRGRIRRITNSYPNDPKSPFYDPTGLPMKPLAKLTITRQRVYEKSCSDVSYLTNDEVDGIEPDEDTNRPECRVSEWTHWSSCSATCGKGNRMRSRSYLMPMKAQMTGCRRQLVEKEMCRAVEPYCPGGGAFSEPILDFDPQICATTEWSEWSGCAVTCGKGLRMRNRRYKDRMGRKKCNEEIVQKDMCMADILECPEGAEEVITPECAVTEWSTWTPCSVTCSEGTMSRSRYYYSSASAIENNCRVRTMEKVSCLGNNRPNCSIGPSEREEVCNEPMEKGPCRIRGQEPPKRFYYNAAAQTCLEFDYSGCRGNRNNFFTHDECMSVCGGLTGNNGPMMQKPNGHGFGGPNEHSSPYAPGSLIGLQPVDCMVTPWSEWSTCSKTCGRGKMERLRMVKVPAQNGGKKCPKKMKRRKRCNLPECNVGYSGLQSYNQYKETPVTADVTNTQVSNTHVSNPHYEPYNEYIAPALYNPSYTDTRQSPAENLFMDKSNQDRDDGAKVDCVMGEWGPWSPCTNSCGSEALQQRSRAVIVDGKNGGTICGDRYERRYCTLPPCPIPRG